MLPTVSTGTSIKKRLATLRNRLNAGLVAGAVLFAFVLVAILLGPHVSQYSPFQPNLDSIRVPPMRTHLLGTDPIGRDLATRLLYGGQYSLIVSGAGMAGSILVGLVLGLVAAFGGRLPELAVLRLIDVQLAFPYVLLGIAITSAVRPSIWVLIVLMLLAGWAAAARVVRSVAIQERSKDYVKAATAIGASPLRIALKYVLPSVLPSILVLAPMQMSAMIVFESTLSFLGMGIQPPTPSWGGMMLDGKDYLATSWWITTFPGVAIFITALGLILIGEGANKVLNRRFDMFEAPLQIETSPPKSDSMSVIGDRPASVSA